MFIAKDYDAAAVDRNEPEYHIGKRSAAGHYCWDCRLTLCKDGEDGLHQSCRHEIGCRCRWFNACPQCGGKVQKNGFNPVDVELGFAASLTVKPTGVTGASSFSYAQKPKLVEQICQEFSGEKVVENEYGKRFTGAEFLQMLDTNCPIRFIRFIGQWFG